MSNYGLSFEKIAKGLGVSKTLIHNQFAVGNGSTNPFLCKQVYDYLLNSGVPEHDIPENISRHKEIVLPKNIPLSADGYFDFPAAFNLSHNPFDDYLETEAEVYRSKDLTRSLGLLRGAVDSSRFIALIASTGYGKSIIKSLFIERLKKENVQVVIPDILDQERLTINHVTSALWYELVDKKKCPLKDKTSRENHIKWSLMKGRAKRIIIIIDEAHTIPPQTISALKRLLEWSDGMRRYFSIVLIGQEHLGHTLSMPQMKEVANRTRSLFLQGFSDVEDMKAYIEKRLSRAGGSVEKLFTSNALETLFQRIKSPLSLNRIVEVCLEKAASLGEKQVSGEIVLMVAR